MGEGEGLPGKGYTGEPATNREMKALNLYRKNG